MKNGELRDISGVSLFIQMKIREPQIFPKDNGARKVPDAAHASRAAGWVRA
jgi:hypothetical protein